MTIFKCKMCGGELEITDGATVVQCEYCGTQQTLPKLDDDRRANLYDRANHFRRNNEFDKAMGIYEQILNEDGTDAEAYWSLILCRYGIEYVEDPASHRRIPTVNRAQFTSVFDDDNYKSALQNADSCQKAIYEAEAKEINEIQKGILAISQKEDPFDVFICYKETDNNGRRTPDSVLAQELYFQLTQEGFKVFFSRITLEDKLGSAYEPYIFAALNSAKVMVALGTKPEHFKAVWVRNEWSRYLSLIKSGAKKMLIPAYKDMDPYDLPEEFSHLQAQDMSKLGFMQDLIRGIKKILATDAPKPTVVKETIVTNTGNTNTVPLLERAFMFLEDGDWERADGFCEQVLNIEPKNARAYLGKLMAELRVKTQDSLKDCLNPFDSNNYYQKALRFAEADLKNALIGYIEHIVTRNENARLESIYTRAKNTMSAAKTENAYTDSIRLLETIPGWKDADELIIICKQKIEVIRQQAEQTAQKIYENAKNLISKRAPLIQDYKSALIEFRKIPNWKDSNEQIAVCQIKIQEFEKKEESYRLECERQKRIALELEKKKKKRRIFFGIIAVILICIAVVLGINASKRNEATAALVGKTFAGKCSGNYYEWEFKIVFLSETHCSITAVTDAGTWVDTQTYPNMKYRVKGGMEELILDFDDPYCDGAEPFHIIIKGDKITLKSYNYNSGIDMTLYEKGQRPY